MNWWAHFHNIYVGIRFKLVNVCALAHQNSATSMSPVIDASQMCAITQRMHFMKTFAPSIFVTNELWYCLRTWNMWRYFEHFQNLHINLILLFIDSLYAGCCFCLPFSILTLICLKDGVGRCSMEPFSLECRWKNRSSIYIFYWY